MAPTSSTPAIVARAMSTYRAARGRGMSHDAALAHCLRRHGLAKTGPTVALGDAPGQTVTVNANQTTLIRTYKTMRRRGLKHAPALKLARHAARRAHVAKAAHAPYAALHPPIIHHGKLNWVDKVGGLPGPIDAIARVLISKGRPEGESIAIAVSQAKKQCATGRAFGGKVRIGGPAHAVICAAVAEWEVKKAAARAT